MTKSLFKDTISHNTPYFNKIKPTDEVLWVCFSLWLIVDTITGYALNSNLNTPLSQVFKTFILLLLISRLINNYKYLLYTLLITTLTGILFLSSSFHNGDCVASLLTLSKLICTIYIYFYLILCIKIYRSEYITKSYKIIKIAFLIVSINIGLGIFGMGFYTYPSEEVGRKGFFFAGNELGGVFAAIIPFMLYVIYLNFSRLNYLISSSFVILLSIILGTKSVILICLLSVIAVPYLLSDKKQRRKIIIIGMLIATPIIAYLVNILIDSEAGLIIKLMYSYDTKGFEGLIFSGRNDFLEERGSIFFNGDIFIKIFGLCNNLTVEMDLFDTLLNFGYLGLTLNVLLYVYLLFVAYRHKKNNSYIRILIFQDWLLIIMSMIAGHIVYSSMAGLYIAMINSLVYVKDKSKCLITLS